MCTPKYVFYTLLHHGCTLVRHTLAPPLAGTTQKDKRYSSAGRVKREDDTYRTRSRGDEAFEKVELFLVFPIYS